MSDVPTLQRGTAIPHLNGALMVLAAMERVRDIGAAGSVRVLSGVSMCREVSGLCVT
jgi:hypothetical protein